MIIKGLVDEDFINYYLPSMVIAFPSCTFKCDKECGQQVCQNSVLAVSPNIDVDIHKIVKRYMENPITHSVVCGGLEPMDSFDDLYSFAHELRQYTSDDIVIYTGYYKEEIIDKVNLLNQLGNIVIKYGRYIPNQEKHYDEILGVNLASNNQYAERS